MVTFSAGSSVALVALSGVYLVLPHTHPAACTPTPGVPSVVFDAFMRIVSVKLLNNHRHVIVPYAQASGQSSRWVGHYLGVVATLAIRALTRRTDFEPGRKDNRVDGLVRAGVTTRCRT